MICHVPPFGANDSIISEAHTGFKSFRKFIENNHVKFLLNGHSYPPKSLSKINDTVIIYCNGIELWNTDLLDINNIPIASSY